MECLGETRNVYIVAVGKSEGNGPFFGPRLARTVEICLQERRWAIECDLSGNGRLSLNMVITFRFHTMLGIS